MVGQKSFQAKPGNFETKCYLIDANGKVLGRLASTVASILRGKNKPQYQPNVDTGDMVVIINAEKIRVTGNKKTQKTYTRYTGYPSGLRAVTLEKMMEIKPEKVLEHAIKGMLPKGALGSKMYTKLHVYAGDQHPHTAQKPELLEV